MADIPAMLDRLAEEFWDWRAAAAPDSYDDIPRMERPPGWTPDWSPTALTERRRRLGGVYERYRGLDVSGEPITVQVDARLLGCALDPVHWELELLRGWQRNPWFYLDQGPGPAHNPLPTPRP